jgi:hypothetical protein
MNPALKKLQVLILQPTLTTLGKPKILGNMANCLYALTNKTKAI